MKINVIVSYSENLVIGNDNERLWDYAEELEHFQKIISSESTKKSILILGHSSYLKYILYDAIKIVITTKKIDGCIEPNDTYFVDSFGSCIDKCRELINITDQIFVCGGESIYKYFFTSYFYKYLDKIYITYIDKKYIGNKTFYPLENHFLYTDIQKSIIYPEIEYRELQYDMDFINPENIFLDYLRELIRMKLIDDVSYFNFDIKIDLTKYFPIFDSVKKNIYDMLSKILISINSLPDIPDLLDLYDIKPYESKYIFNQDNNNLSLTVQHKTGNILNEIIYNILFSSLLLMITSKIRKCNPYLINYKCENAFFNKNQLYTIDKIAWIEAGPLPLIEIKDRGQKHINEFNIDDIIILGL